GAGGGRTRLTRLPQNERRGKGKGGDDHAREETRPRRSGADRNRQPRRAARAPTRTAQVERTPRLRERTALPQALRRTRGTSRRSEIAGRSGEIPFHHEIR